MKSSLLTATAISLALLTAPAFADAETDALKKEIRALSARIAELEKREKSAPAAPKKLEQRLAVIERKQEVAQEIADSKKTPSVEVGSKGFAITSPDKQYSVRMRAYGQVQHRQFFDNGNTTSTSQFLVRSARPIVEAKMTDYFNGRLMMDFGGGNTRLLDAYADFKPVPESKLLALRFGKFKAPIGLERWQAEQELLFAERGQTTNLVPFRDIGVMALGEIVPDQLEYQLSYTNGVVDIGDSNSDADNHKDISARLFAHPFRWSGYSWLQGFGIGAGATAGEHTGSTAAPGLTAGYVSMGQSRYFTYNASSFANGTQWRFNPQSYYYNGPFSLLGEYVVNAQELRNGATQRTIRNNAWNAITTYVLTGEDASFDGVKPADNFDPAKGKWGAFEITARAGALRVDRDAFPIFASIASSARRATEGAVGINWYMNQSVKLNIDFARTLYDGGATVGDRESESVLLSQAQFRF